MGQMLILSPAIRASVDEKRAWLVINKSIKTGEN